MEITGRVASNATVKTVNGSDKQVVNFSVAINHSFRSKGTTEVTRKVLFVECDYWFNTGIAPFLTKGTIVKVYGYPELHAYISNKTGFPVAVLRLHTQDIQLISGANKEADEQAETPEANAEQATETVATGNGGNENADDLPF